MQFALIQRLESGRFIAARHRDESELARATRTNAIECWMFLEDELGRTPAEVLWVYVPSHGTVYQKPGIQTVPDDVLRQVYPPMIMEMAA